MADISITAANVVPQAGATIDKTHNYGETVTAGMPVILSGGKYVKAKKDTAEHAAASGIAANSGSLDQPAAVQTAGSLSFGAILTAGETYAVGAAYGGICPIADIGASDYGTILGMATTTSLLSINIQASGVAHG